MISPSPNVFHSAHEDRGGEDLSALSPAKAVASITVAEMKSVLRQADCLYDKPEIWRQLGVTGVSEIPDSVIQEAYEVGGRIILRCSSVVEKAFALRRVGICIDSYDFEPDDIPVRNPAWIVVPSHIDKSTLGAPIDRVLFNVPRPTIEAWVAVLAYAKLDGNRQPEGCEDGLHVLTDRRTTVVGAFDNNIMIIAKADRFFSHSEGYRVGAARFGPPRNCKLDIQKVGESKNSVVTTTQVGSLGLGLLSPGIKIKDISPSASDDFSL